MTIPLPEICFDDKSKGMWEFQDGMPVATETATPEVINALEEYAKEVAETENELQIKPAVDNENSFKSKLSKFKKSS